MTLVLAAHQLGFSYSSDHPVFEGLNLEVHSGESTGLIGGNGSGKSTLLWCLLGLLKAQGEILLFGEQWNKRALRRIGVVFQNPEDQLFMPTVAEDLQLVLSHSKREDGEVAARALELLDHAGLTGAARRPLSQLSLGERKRVAIVAALAHNPDLLLLDEPTAELDGRAKRQLMEVLERLSVPRLIVSHDLDFLRRVTTRLSVLGEGRILGCGPTEEILEDEALLLQAGVM
jgi:cobalt/nickel transport system ATP-binding protein